MMLENPYLETVAPYLGNIADRAFIGSDRSLEQFTRRKEWSRRWSYAIPNVEAIAALVRYSPLVEIGAGSGYWASLIAQAGGDVICYDLRRPTFRFECRYHDILAGGAASAGRHPGRTLFLCWPPYGTPMARNALRAHRKAGGKRLVVVGEEWGCTGNDAFWRALNRDYFVVEEVAIPQYACIKDNLTVWDVR